MAINDIALLQEVEQENIPILFFMNELISIKKFSGRKNFITEVFYGVIQINLFGPIMISQKVKEIQGLVTIVVSTFI